MPPNTKFYVNGIISGPGLFNFGQHPRVYDHGLHCPCARFVASFFYASSGTPDKLIADKNCTICDGTGIVAVPFSDLDLSNVEDDVNV